MDPKPADALPAAIAPAIPTRGRVFGALDMLRPDRIGGWAIDRGNRGVALEVDVFREGRRVATIRGRPHAQDLARGDDGHGNHGFALALDPPLEPGSSSPSPGGSRERRRQRRAAPCRGGRRGARRAAHPRRLFEEVARLRHEPRDAAGLSDVLQRIEVAQARIDAALAAIEAPRRRRRRPGSG